MLLSAWMEQNRWTDARFIMEINKILARSKHRTYSHRSVATWRKGLNMPRPTVIEAIDAFTDGAVLYSDHMNAVNNAKESAAA